jgi:hypothetical protein
MKKMKKLYSFRQIFILSLAIFTFLFSVEAAKACSCVTLPLEWNIEESSNIAVLKLQAVEKYEEKEKGRGYGGVKQSKFSVEKILKGNLKVGQMLDFSQGGGTDCILIFAEEQIGTDFLFFLGDTPKKSELWRGFVCSRTNTVKAAADLMYLERSAGNREKTRLSGTVSLTTKPAVEGEKGSYETLAGKSLTIKGNGEEIKLKTDENGVYEIYGLPAGKYQITPEKTSGYQFDEGKEAAEIEIKADKLAEQDFEFTTDNSITGKFLDSYGNSLEGVSLDLLPARGNRPPYFYQGSRTDENGVFEFKGIPVGNYVIVINEENEISAQHPFGTFYYPNKINRAEALEIKISAGEHLKNLTITAPTTAETIIVSGALFYEDGKPAEYESIKFFNNIEDINKIEKYKLPDSVASTDAQGKFRIKILKGQKGILFGSITSYIGKYKNCSKLDALVKAKGESAQYIETPVIQINTETDLSGLNLKFPFPGCKKSKID